MAKGLPSGLWRPEACSREPFSQCSECHDRVPEWISPRRRWSTADQQQIEESTVWKLCPINVFCTEMPLGQIACLSFAAWCINTLTVVFQ